MKKYLFLLTAMTLFTANVSGRVITKQIAVDESFSELSISSQFEVVLTQSDDCSVSISISEELEPYIVATVKGNRLTLGLKSTPLKPLPLFQDKSHKTIRAKVSMPTISYLSLSGASALKSHGTFVTKDLNAIVSGASHIDGLHIEASEITLSMSGASGIEESILNSTNEFKLDMSGASNAGIECNNSLSHFTLSGASHAELSGTSNSSVVMLRGASVLNADDFIVKEVFDYTSLGASRSTLVGKADSAIVVLSGASILEANDFCTRTMDIKLEGASHATVWTLGNLRSATRGASTLTTRPQ